MTVGVKHGASSTVWNGLHTRIKTTSLIPFPGKPYSTPSLVW